MKISALSFKELSSSLVGMQLTEEWEFLAK
jgi:hypothetical protein